MYAGVAAVQQAGHLPLATQTEVHDGCPLDCGLCPDHKQHACVGLIEVNTPATSTARSASPTPATTPTGSRSPATRSRPASTRSWPPKANRKWSCSPAASRRSTRRSSSSARMARNKGVRSVVLNTNGIRLAHDPTLRRRRSPSWTCGIYLQFDGLDAATHLAFRGRDLREAKAKALERCAEAGLAVLLVAAVDADTNLDQVGDIVRYGITHPAVRGVVFQPVTRAGRMPTFDPLPAAHQPRRDQGVGRPVPGLVPPLGLLPRPVLLPDLPLDHLPPRRRRGRVPHPAAAADGELPRLHHQPRPARPVRRQRPGGPVERLRHPRHRRHDRPAHHHPLRPRPPRRPATSSPRRRSKPARAAASTSPTRSATSRRRRS